MGFNLAFKGLNSLQDIAQIFVDKAWVSLTSAHWQPHVICLRVYSNHGTGDLSAVTWTVASIMTICAVKAALYSRA